MDVLHQRASKRPPTCTPPNVRPRSRGRTETETARVIPLTARHRNFATADAIDGIVLRTIPYARVVQIDAAVADASCRDGHGPAWIVQTSLLAKPQRESDWWTIERIRAQDGKIGPRGRKVYEHLLKLPPTAIAEAMAVMSNASSCLLVFVSLLVEARKLLRDHAGSPPFSLVREFFLRTREREAAFHRSVRAEGETRAARRFAYGCPPPDPLAQYVLEQMLRGDLLTVPVATDGISIGRFAADFDFEFNARDVS